jgi:hypothetical protein
MMHVRGLIQSQPQTINAGCYNIDNMNGTQVCVSVPGRPYTTPAPTTLAPTIPITAAPVPTDVAAGINTYCGKYYQAKLGDYCNMIVIKFGISLDDFVFLNPVINANCTNLFADESYCVEAVGDSEFSLRWIEGAEMLMKRGSQYIQWPSWLWKPIYNHVISLQRRCRNTPGCDVCYAYKKHHRSTTCD